MSRIEKALELAAQLRNGAPLTAAAGNEATSFPSGPGAPQEEAPRNVERQLRQARTTVCVNGKHPLITTLTDPHSGVSEQYRKLKSRLVHLTGGDHRRNLLMVTSAVTGDGKSLTATNLGISMAQELDRSVLLVDADLRRPSLHHLLGFSQEVGLAECLVNGVDLGDAVVRTDIDKLSVLTAGKETAKPQELFDTQKLQRMLEEIRHRYRDSYVIIDTPPLLPFAEPRALAHLVDGIILVIREGVTSRDSVSESLEILKECPVLGMVLNESNGDNQECGRYGEYYRRGSNH